MRERFFTIRKLGPPLKSALQDLFRQEFSYSTGHVAAVLNTCLFAPSLLTFWFINGILDFSTAIAIGSVASPAGLQIRLIAYVLLVPAFILTRISLHLSYPAHRRQVLAGSCPNTQLLSLDWFSMGILATGLPLALQNFGPWVVMNSLFFAGVFVLPRFISRRFVGPVKFFGIATGGSLFLFFNYGAMVTWLPAPETVLGPVATMALSDETTNWLMRIVNSVAVGPVFVGLFGVFMNHVLTRPELTDIPLLHYALPRRDPDAVVSLSAASGTVFYLLIVYLLTGTIVTVP